MRKLTASFAVLAIVVSASPLSTASQAAVGRSIDTVIDAVTPIESVGCFRWGETGYHWYRYCFGPYWLYPHRRVCSHGACWYR